MKKLLSAILTICLVLSCAAPALAASFPDLEARHAWAVPAIDYMMSKGIVNGYEDDTFRPDRTVTRVEFIKMLNMTFGLTATAAIPYTDVPADQWYAPYVKQAVAQGYLLNYGSLLNPNGALSRQEAAALLVRYLNPDESLKASSTTFTDYSSVKAAYRDYVLLAAGIGLINGYEDDTFKPDKTLNRAEALTILYRAAGMICNDNVVESEAGAGDKNAVIIKNNITVTGAYLPGRVIITEGVSGGTVTLSECQIGELIVRGTPTVILSGCTVDSMIVDCSSKGKTAPLSLLAGTVVKDMTLRTPADISTAARTTLTKLTVESGASRSTLGGSGTFTNAVINASGFVSDKKPTNYTLGLGISATFAGSVYTSSSTPSASATGFTAQPSLYTSSSYTYLKLTAAKAGTVHYYYTNTATTPTAELFDNYYAVAAVRSNFMVSANRSLDTQIGSTAAVGSYSHVVVKFTDTLGVDYQPIVLSNQSSSGFTVAPTVSTNGSYQYLSFTPAIDGTLYYYYTNSSTPLSANSFASALTSGAAMYKGDIEVTTGKAVSQALAVASTVSNYAYVAVMLEDNMAKLYQPVLIPTGGTGANSATGFTDSPYCNTLNNGVALGFTPTYSGVVEYYFTTGSTVPTTSEFEYYKSISQVTLTGSVQVTAGTASYSPLLNTVNPTMYPYIVIRLKSTSGTTYTPVVIRISTTSGSGSTTPGTSGSGFATMPTVTYAAGKFILNFQASMSGTVYYYLTTSPNSPGSAFMGNYNSSTSPMISTKLGGILTATGMAQSQQTVLATDLSEDYDYMAVMLQSGNTAYTPVVIPVPDVEAVVIQDTGFVVGPIYNEYTETRHQIEFATSVKGTVWYYFTDSPETPSSSDIIEAVLYGGEGVYDRGRQAVNKLSSTLMPLNIEDTLPGYVVMMLVDENDNYYLPIVLTTSGMYGASSVTSGFVERENALSVIVDGMTPILNYTCTETGKLYYFFTNSPSSINTVWDFFMDGFGRGYLSSYADGVRGTIDLSVGKGSVALPVSKSVSSYTHVAIMLQNSGYAPGGYRKPLVVALNATGSSGTSSSYSGFSTSPYLSGTSVYFTPKTTGTVYYGFTQTNDTSALYENWGLGSLGTLGGTIGTANVSAYLASANYGGSMPISWAGYTQSIAISSTNLINYKYMAIWTVDTSDTMSKIEFVPLSNASIGGTTTSGTGFLVAPSYNSYTRQLSFTPSVAGTVAYVCSDSTSITTYEQFVTAFNNATVKNTTAVSALQPTTITINASLNKYVWVMLYTVEGNYTPVRIQLY